MTAEFGRARALLPYAYGVLPSMPFPRQEFPVPLRPLWEVPLRCQVGAVAS